MSRQELYEASRKVYALYGSFFAIVARELGTERALDLHAQAHEEQGLKSGELLRRTIGQMPGIEKLGAVLQASNLSIGIDCELGRCDARSTLFSNGQCPMYDGYRQGGLDDGTAEALCQRGADAKLGAMLHQLDPAIEYRLTRYRSEPDGVCQEEIGYLAG